MYIIISALLFFAFFISHDILLLSDIIPILPKKHY